MDKVLVFGASGLLGSHAAFFFDNLGYSVVSVYNKHRNSILSGNPVQLSLLSEDRIWEIVNAVKPSIILNCAGLTSVEECELNPGIAFSIHETFPKFLARISASTGSYYIHISTDHLWEGTKSFYSEEELPNPVNIYGKSKAKGEELVLIENLDSLVIRTNFFGKGSDWRKSFSDWIIENLSKKNPIQGFEDIFFTPISIPYLLKYLYQLTEDRHSGIFNLAGLERISKFDFILKVAKYCNLDSSLVAPSRYFDNKNHIPRPKDMSLNINKLKNVLTEEFCDLNEYIKSVCK